ncbi:MAG: COX15/CtaA family protein [Gammaproteobacteria bacterium]
MRPHSFGYCLLAALATLLALVVVMLGAYTRLGDAGLGCPDWPGCYGHIAVPETAGAISTAEQKFQQPVEPAKAWKEMVHRYFAGTLGVFIGILFIWGLVRRMRYPNQPLLIPTLLILLVIFQALLGMWTVTLKVQPLVVSSHLLGGMAIAALLWYLTLATRPYQPSTAPALSFKPWAILGLLVVIVQLFLGAWTSTNYAALACTSFPLCHGTLFPHLDLHEAFTLWQPLGVNYEGGVLSTTARITIQMMHRYWGFITAGFVLILSLALMSSKANKKLRGIGWVLFILILTQFILGILNVVWLLPRGIAVAHNGVAALLLLSMTGLLYKLNRKTVKRLVF